LQHYFFESFIASETPSVAKTKGEEGVPLLSLDKNPKITLLRSVGFNLISLQWKSEKETTAGYFGSFMGRTLKVSFETGFVQNRLIVREKAFKDDRKHWLVQDVDFERTLIFEKMFNLNHLLLRLAWSSMTKKSMTRTISHSFSQHEAY